MNTKILDEMKRRELKPADLARKMGRSPQWLNGKLKAHSKITLNDLSEFAAAFGVFPGDLLPTSILYDISKMSFVDLMKKICDESVSKKLNEYFDKINQAKNNDHSS